MEATMSYLGMKQLLEAGVHFGHETKRWNPKMKRYIFAERNGIFIIDLQKTLVESEKAFDYLKDLAGRGGTILFVGTKKQAQEILAAEAKRCGMPFINERWLGGLLTNFRTIRTRVERLKQLEQWFEDGTIRRYNKKEQIDLGKELQRLQRYLGGIRDMHRLPDALFIIDPTKEAIAAKEANKLDIPVVALADTDSDPDVLDHIIPGNDDAIRSIQLVTARLADAIVEVKGGADAEATEPPLEAVDVEQRETLPTPVSSPERTIQAAASAAGEEGAEVAPAPTPEATPDVAPEAESPASEAPEASEPTPPDEPRA
jgi:small subunit ribosomal protein S2